MTNSRLFGSRSNSEINSLYMGGRKQAEKDDSLGRDPGSFYKCFRPTPQTSDQRISSRSDRSLTIAPQNRSHERN